MVYEYHRSDGDAGRDHRKKIKSEETKNEKDVKKDMAGGIGAVRGAGLRDRREPQGQRGRLVRYILGEKKQKGREIMGAFVDLTGQRFGRLTVIERSNNKGRRVAWLCYCDCGNKVIALSERLIAGRNKSCGCLHKELLSKGVLKHGKRKTRLYGVYSGIKERCYNPRHNRYYRYGGRGITMCDEWRDNFQAFYDWAMANGYDENAPFGECTIDRIDVNGNYCPENCRWVDMKTQNCNKEGNG